MQTRKRRIVKQDIPFLVDVFLSEKGAVRTHAAVSCAQVRLNRLMKWTLEKGYSINPKKWGRDHVLAFRKDLIASGLKTAPDIFMQAKYFWRWMERNRFVEFNPFDGVQSIPARRQNVREPFTDEEFRSLVDAIKHDKNGDQWATAFTVGYYTGMAISDSVCLKWREIDMDACVIRRNRNKTDVRATIPFERGGELCNRLIEMKEKYPPSSDDAYVMPYIAIRTSSGCAVFAKARDLVGLPKEKTFHNFRATMASRLVNGGVSAIVARRITGHRSITVFDKYVKVADEVLEKAIRDAGYIPSAPKIGQEVAV